MNHKSRIINSFKNIKNGLISQIVSLVFNFIVRTIFVKYLSEDYLGINGLFTNILSILSLAELGFGSAIVYSLYAPLAKNDIKKIQAIMNFYKKVYMYIGIVIGILGISIIPFLDYIIKDYLYLNNLNYIYMLFLVDSVSSYFFAYKRSILIADQKEYVSSRYRYIFTIIKSLMQIVVLVIFKNFILYLIVQILTTILENIYIAYKINKIYPFLNSLNNEVLCKNELIKIKKDVNALFIVKFGHVMLNGTDNIIISSFVGIQWVGLLSNYNLVIGSIIMLLSQIISGLTGSIGNFIAKEELREVYKLFKKIDFLNFWLYGVAAICLCILLNPFIELWIGKSYLIEQNTVNVLVINFFINGMTSFLWMFRSTMGLFTKAKYRPVLCSILNIFISIILGKYVGLIGVLLGTTISRLLTNLSFDPYIIYKFGLKKNVKSYYMLYFYRIILLVFIYLCLDFIKLKLFIDGVNIIGFMILMFLSILLPNIIFLLAYQKSNEFNYIKAIIKSQVNFI